MKKSKKRDRRTPTPEEAEDSDDEQLERADAMEVTEVDPALKELLQTVSKGLTEVTGNPEILSAEELEADDVEVFLIQCPENINLEELLKGKKLKLENESVTSLKSIDDENYESVFLTDENEKTLTVVLPDATGNRKIVSSRLSGHIVVRETIDELSVPELELEDKGLHQLPAGLKERHPVYGTDFREALLSMENGTESEISETKVHKSKKKKKKDRDNLVIEQANESSNTFQDYADKNDDVGEFETSKKHKKKKKNRTAIAEPDDEPTNNAHNYDYDDTNVPEVNSSKKKKKKSKIEVKEEPVEDNQIVSDNESERVHKKKKKKRKLSGHESESLEEHNLNIEEVETPRKKKKRIKQEQMD